jgi:L-ribulose-5-phosphate 4-epimerase
MGILQEHKVLAEKLSRYSRLCYDRHLVGAAGGNLSVRVPGKDFFLITASGVALRDVSPDNLVVVDSDCRVLENPAGLKPSKETGFHLAVYSARPSVQAVVHVHPAFVTVYSSSGGPIPLVTVSAVLKLKQGPIVADAHPGSQELRESMRRAVQESPADTTVILMERHGLVAFGPSLCEAFDNAELAEDTAKIACLTSRRFQCDGRVVDLTALLNAEIQCYPTDPPFRKSWHAQMKTDGAYVSRLELGLHAGTHVDAPLHFLEGGDSVAMMPPRAFFGEALAIAAPKNPGENIRPEDFAQADIRAGDIVLFRTRWEERASSPRFFQGEWPGFTVEAIAALIQKKVKAIGGDIASADSPQAIANGAPAHKKALQAGIPIFEGLVNMREIVGRRFFFIGLPLRIDEGEASPVRAVAVLV